MSLPIGAVVRLERHVRVLDGGAALLGGHPMRLLRLAPRARPLVTDRTVLVRDAATAALADRLVDAGLADPVVGTLPDRDDPWTLVVPVRDRPGPLDRLLASVHGASEVIVVDDASADPAAVAAVARRHGARLVALPENLGPAGARNAGLAEVATPVVVFCDSDIVLDPDTVPLLLRHLADPRVAVVAPRIAGLGASPSWLGRYEDTRSSLDLGEHPAQVRPRSPVAWVTTACVVARREALTDGFDASLRVGEDVDLGWRLTAAGHRVRYEPAAVARHEHRERPADWFLRKAVYGSGAQGLADRHPAHIAPAVLAPWSAAFLALVAVQRRWSLAAAGVVLVGSGLRIGRRLAPLPQAPAVGLRLAATGGVSALAQGMALLLRHWWPAAVVACLVSRRARRAVLVAAVVDVALEYRRDPAHLDPLRFALARRLDDLAYGAGVWWSALRARSTAALRPAIVRTTRR
ncbi:mycofactocin biosynthesis glycosyltransferase MftF [Amnibacterium endophyticum]|uniref:Mycofactocin biosynthesis glycosyltransferase MftF n=1 Tax=Amnibacterium endophyticum TaxID=2109337 RepID=A0ABW4LHI0_9MICO